MAEECKTQTSRLVRANQLDVDVEALPPTLNMDKKGGAAQPPSPPSRILAPAEEGATIETRETTKANENLEFGGSIAGFGVSMMVAWYILFPGDRGAHNLRCIIPLFLGFACLISGVCLMLLSMNLLELPQHLVSESQLMVSKYLSWLCSALPVVTLISPFLLSGYKLYRYIGLALLVVVTAPLAVVRWYVGLKAQGGDEEAALREHKEQLEAAFKLVSAISNSAFTGVVALVVNYNVTGGSGKTKSVVLVAIFLVFTTLIWGLLYIAIRDKVLEINSPRLRGCIIKCMSLAIIFIHLLLACAVLAVAFDIVEFSIFAAFAPWVFAAAVHIFKEHCVGRTTAQDSNPSDYQKARLKWKAEMGHKITMWSFTAIIAIFGGFLHGKAESLKACTILFTSAFMSGFALTVATIKPDLTSVGLAAATTVLDWTAKATFAAAIFAIIIAVVLDIF
ncbi:uncharacterized protein LOC119271893 [Triticum dicoccoides]|uniref:uncharacterized protein LOC119271893 n=1 Tax=Triticum dicoccoides TaxID=85692 RepID=UPI00162EC6FA|nr:uncharacterized protein LOC119271893 [Triticum dicoccoides]XP_044335963.1 uncharacterized protein LOC123056744 [Triticum aestivum]